jgi:hypothetical protein
MSAQETARSLPGNMMRSAGAIVAGMIAVVVLSLGTDLGLRLVGLYRLHRPRAGVRQCVASALDIYANRIHVGRHRSCRDNPHEFGSELVPDLIGFKSFSVQLARLEAASSAWLSGGQDYDRA